MYVCIKENKLLSKCIGALCSHFSAGEKCKHYKKVPKFIGDSTNTNFETKCYGCNTITKRISTTQTRKYNPVGYDTIKYNDLPICSSCQHLINLFRLVRNKRCVKCNHKLLIEMKHEKDIKTNMRCSNIECSLFGVKQ